MNALMRLMSKIEMRIKSAHKEKDLPNDQKDARDLRGNSVTKSNALARGYYRFTLVEKRVMEALISQLNPQSSDTQLQKLELKALDYSKAFGVSEKNAYDHIESAVKGLMHKVFSVENPKGREDFTLMSNAKYLTGEGRISCSFNSYVTPHLTGLRQRFSKYSLQITSNFKSSYSWRVYEILVSWAQDPKLTDGLLAGWCTVEVDDLRKMLGVPNSYPWAVFEKRVLDVAKLELAEKANIVLEVERIKTGRKITHLKLTFAEMKQGATT